MPTGISRSDEGREECSVGRGASPADCRTVEDPEADPDEQEERKLNEDNDARTKQGSCGFERLRAASRRWTMSWSVPCEAMVRKVPPSTPVQKV